MRTLLIHMSPDGKALGIFDEDGEYFYLRRAQQWVAKGVLVMRSRGTESIWEEWVDSLANKAQSQSGMWVDIESDQPLETALLTYINAESFR